MFKVAVIGCGGIGNAHARSWKQVEGVELVGVVDLVEEKAKATAEKFGCAAFTDMAALPDGLDAVSVVVPPRGHYPIVKTMLQKGLHVYCEKPLTLDPAQGEELDKLAAAQGKQLSVGFKMRFEPIFQKAREVVGEIGEIRSIVTTKQQKFNDRPEGQWVKATGAMYELSIHDFDLISFITGLAPQKVLAAKLMHRRGWEKEDAFNAIVQYDNGAIANLQGLYCDQTTFCYRDLTITLLGEKGYIRIERPDRIVVHTDAFRVIDIPDALSVNTFAVELGLFKAACLGQGPNAQTAADAVRMTRLIEEIRTAGEA